MKKHTAIKYVSTALIFVLLPVLLLIPSASAAGKTTNVLVYMVASDLESHDEAATKDIKEMLSAAKRFGDEINLIVYAGGANQWHNDIFSPEENRCVRIGKNGAELLYADGLRGMTDPSTLADFIRYCADGYPAERNILVLWDHGGGFFGFGADELSDYDEAMSPLELSDALARGGVYFDVIGFDACSMACFEVAYRICDYGRYMVASEEMEPTGGWDYETWLGMLAEYPSIDLIEIGKSISDSYMEWCDRNAPGIKRAMSVIDLDRCRALGTALSNFTKGMTDEIISGQFDVVSLQKALNTNLMEVNHASMIDAIEFAGSLENEQAQELEKQLTESLVYHRKYPASLKKNGLLIYVPVNENSAFGVFPDDFDTMRAMGISESYMDWIEGCRRYSKAVSNMEKPERTLQDVLNYAAGDDFEKAMRRVMSETKLDLTDCYITKDENNMPLLVMPEEQTELTSYIWESVFREIDGETVDYGRFFFRPEDFPLPNEGFWLRMRDDWLFINGVMCPFYMEDMIELSDGRPAVYGYTRMFRDGDEGALYLRLLYDSETDLISVEPICFQEVDFTKEKLQFGRVEMVADIDSEATVYFCCATRAEKREDSQPVRITEDMRWGDVTSFESKEPDESDSYFASYFVIDIYQNMHEIAFVPNSD